jgi:hypothetical protein
MRLQQQVRLRLRFVGGVAVPWSDAAAHLASLEHHRIVETKGDFVLA